MAQSKNHAHARHNVITGWLSQISEGQLETLAIVLDVNQMTWLMTSMHEAKSGQIVSARDAFADLDTQS